MLTEDLLLVRTPDSYLRNYESMTIDSGVMSAYFSTLAGNKTVMLREDDIVRLIARDFERLSNKQLKGEERARVQNEYDQLMICAGDFDEKIDPKLKAATGPYIDILEQPRQFRTKPNALKNSHASMLRLIRRCNPSAPKAIP